GAEADMARGQRKLIQTTIDGAEPPMPFNQLHYVSLADWQGESDHPGWTKVRERLAALAGPTADMAAAPPPEAPTVPPAAAPVAAAAAAPPPVATQPPPTPPSMTPPAPAPRRGGNRLLIVIIVLAVLIIAAVGVLAL